MIPRRLALRIWSACLHGRAGWLRSLTGPDALRLADRHRAATGALRKIRSRLALADELDAVGRIVESWTGDDRRCHGADLDPATVAWVCAYTCGETERALPELRRLGAIRMDDPVGGPRDVLRAVERLLAT
jgi:hypothetical protein